MRENRVHMAMVIDEHGQTAGIITIEDVIEEIVGPIRDEYDAMEEEEIQFLAPNEAVLDARISLADAGDLLGLQLQTEDVDSLGGYIQNQLGAIPKPGETIQVMGVTMTVVSVRGQRIGKVRVRAEKPFPGSILRDEDAQVQGVQTPGVTGRPRSGAKGQMPVYTAEAVILRKVDYGEADRIMTIFTLERGKISAIAKSVRKSKSRMSGQLDVFAHGHMMLAEGRSMDVVTSFQRLTDDSLLATDLHRSAAAALVVEVADKVLEERHPQPDLFSLVRDGLARLAAADAAPRMEALDFTMRVLAELGYAPELTRCAVCGRPPVAGDALGFAPIAGGIVAGRCLNPGLVPAISERAIKILRVLASGDRGLFLRLRLSEADLVEAEDALEAQLEHHLDRQLKSIDFARKVRPLRPQVQPA